MVVFSTAPGVQAAELIGRTLVEERLAVCANIMEGVTSIFRWKGAVAREREVLVLLKTTVAEVEALRRRLVELHPYEVPEVLAVQVAVGHEPYIEWVRAEVGGETE
jgi:periplasmic divalent cation tolerance protein